MKQKIESKKYYRIQFKLASPLSIGSGKNEYTDNDILRDGKGIPYIPGSALAGIAGEYLQKQIKQYIDKLPFEPEEKTLLFGEIWNRYYGNILNYNEIENKENRKKSFIKMREKYITQNEKEQQKICSGLIEQYIEIKEIPNFYESRLIFYDARMLEENNYHISKRDCVALDEWKTSIDGAKFDLEILEPGVSFVTFIEQNIYKGDAVIADNIAKAWINCDMHIGAKTMRGFGEIKEVEVDTKQFHFENKQEVKQWLKFNMYDNFDWEKFDFCKNQNKKGITLHLKLKGGISIRKYTTCVSDTESIKSDLDYEQLTIHGNIPVIPGTTWAGAFRSHICKLIPDYESEYFGFIDIKTKQKKRSQIRFSESQVYGAESKILTRNSIDRFSGSTIDTALFTEKSYYGGETVLTISFYSNIPTKLMKGLAAAITDLNAGFLSIGGLSSIGRGLFQVTKVNGIEIKQEELYETILEELNKLNEEEK